MRKMSCLIVAVAMFGCDDGTPYESMAQRGSVQPVRFARPEPIHPLTMPVGLDPRRVELGGYLFHDTRLSRDGSIACASCHQIGAGGEDGLRHSPGVDGVLGRLNTPTVLNSGHSVAQFWNGRAETLEDQVGEPLTAPTEMATTWASVLATIRSDPDYVRWFEEAFQDAVTEANTRSALAEFERSLVTVDSKF